MEIIVYETNKKAAQTLIDPTALRNTIHYMNKGYEGIISIVVVQDGYDLAEVVSPFMVHNDEDEQPLEGSLNHVEYLMSLMEKNVVRMIIPDIAMKHVAGRIKPFCDLQKDFDGDEAYEVLLIPPMYWVKSMNKKWE